MKRLLFYLMLLSGLGFAASTVWFGSELWTAFSVKHFDFKSIPTFAISLSIYGLFYVLNKPKTKYINRKLYPLDYPGWAVPEDSQIPVKINNHENH